MRAITGRAGARPVEADPAEPVRDRHGAEVGLRAINMSETTSVQRSSHDV